MSTSTSPFMEMVRGKIRLRGYSLRTEKSNLFWIKKFILFHKKRHPSVMGNAEVKEFLIWLAVNLLSASFARFSRSQIFEKSSRFRWNHSQTS